MPLNKHVMTNAFRTGLIKAYRDALIDAKIGADSAEIKPHINGMATIKLTDAQLEALRAHYGDSLIEMTAHSNSGKIKVLLPAGEKFVMGHRPTLTEEERAAKKSSGVGRGGLSDEERAKREAARERMNKMLLERYGVDLSENKADSEDEETDEE